MEEDDDSSTAAAAPAAPACSQEPTVKQAVQVSHQLMVCDFPAPMAPAVNTIHG